MMALAKENLFSLDDAKLVKGNDELCAAKQLNLDRRADVGEAVTDEDPEYAEANSILKKGVSVYAELLLLKLLLSVI